MLGLMTLGSLATFDPEYGGAIDAPLQSAAPALSSRSGLARHSRPISHSQPIPTAHGPHHSATQILLPITGTVLVAHALALWGLPQLSPPQPADAPIVMETRMVEAAPPPPTTPAPKPAPEPAAPAPKPTKPRPAPKPPLQRRLLRPQSQNLSPISLQPKIRKRNKLLKQKHPQKYHHLHHLQP